MAESVGAIYYDVDARTEGLLDAEKEINRSTRNMGNSLDAAGKKADKFGDSLSKLKPIAAAVASALAVEKLVHYADEWTAIQNRLRPTTKSTQELTQVTSELLKVANASGTSLEATAEAYAQIEQNAHGLGASQKELVRFTDLFNKSLVANGANAQQTESAIQGLARAAEAGVVQGDQFNQIIMNAPIILQALQRETGKTTQELRSMVSSGTLSFDLLYKAITDYSDVIDNRSLNSTFTFAQSMQRVRNNITAIVGDMQGFNGALQTGASVLRNVSDQLVKYSSVFDVSISALGGAVILYGSYRTAVLAATVAQAAFNVAVRANPLTLAITATGALAGALYALRDATVTAGDTTAKVSDFVQSAWQLTSENVESSWQGFKDTFNASLSQIQRATGISTGNIDSAFSGMFDFIVKDLKFTANIIISNFLAIPAVISRVFKAVMHNVSQSIENVADASERLSKLDFSGAKDAIKKDLITPFELMKDLGKDISDIYSSDNLGNLISSVSNRAGDIKTLREFGETVDFVNNKLLKSKENTEKPSTSDSNLLGTVSRSRAGSAKSSSSVEESSILKATLELQRQYNQLVADQRTEEEKSLDTLKERLTLIGRAQVSGIGGDYDGQRERAINQALGDAHSGLQNLSGGQYDDQFSRYDNDASNENDRYSAQQQQLQSALDQQLITEQEYYSRSEAAAQDHASNIQQIEQARNSLMLSTSSDLFGNLADGVRAYAGESNDIYKAMFAASKAFAIADSAVKIQQGIANAAILPFPANIPAMAAVASATGSILSTIASTNMGSGRINGGPVTAGRMYPVTENGKPELYSNGTRNYLLPGRNGSVTSNKDMQGGGIQGVNINVTNTGTPSQIQATTSQQNGVLTIDMLLSDIANNGEVSQSFGHHYDTKRRVR